MRLSCVDLGCERTQQFKTSLLFDELEHDLCGKLVAQLITGGGRGKPSKPTTHVNTGTGLRTDWVSLSPSQGLPPIPATAISSLYLESTSDLVPYLGLPAISSLSSSFLTFQMVTCLPLHLRGN